MSNPNNKNSMSRFVWTLIFVEILILVGVGSFFYFRYRASPQEMLAIVPAQPIAFLHVQNIGKNIGEIGQSQLWQKLSKISYLEVLHHLKAEESQIQIFEQFKNQISIPAVRALLDKFFGQEVVLAVYPLDFTKLDLKNINTMFSSVVVMTRLKPEAEFAELVRGLLGEAGKEVSIRQILYRDHNIQLISAKDGIVEFGYIRIKDVLVFGLGDSPIRKVLDVLDKQAATITTDPFYPLTKEKALPDPEFFGFFNMDYFVGVMTNEVMGLMDQKKDHPMEMAAQFQEYFRQIYGFKMLSLSGRIDTKEARIKLNIHIDPKKMEPDIRPLYQCPQEPQATLAFAPQDVLAYQWSNCYHFDHFWKQAVTAIKQETMGTSTSPDQVIADWENKIHLSIEKDILPAFGHEIGGYLQDIDSKGLFPIPELVIFVRTADQEKARQVIHTLVDLQPIFRLEKETDEGVEFEFIQIPMLASLKPGFSFIDDYFVIATHTDLIKAALAIKQGKTPSLTSRSLWKKSGNTLENSVLYIQMDQLLGRIAGLTEWGNEWVTAQSAKQQAFLAGSQKRLADTENTIREKETAIAAMKDELKSVEQALTAPAAAENSSAGTDASPQVAPAVPGDPAAAPAQPVAPVVSPAQRVEQLKERIRKTEEELAVAQGAKGELQTLIKNYEQQMQDDPQVRRTMLDELIVPMITALQSIKNFVSATYFHDNLIETTTTIQWE